MRTIHAALFTLTAVLIISAGCAKPADTAPTSGGGPMQTSDGSKPGASDDTILKAVKDKFAADSDLSKEKIDIQVKDGRVALSGTVSSDAIKIKAEDTARDASDDVFGVEADKLVPK